MSKPMSRAEMKDWVNETWQKCQEQEPVTRQWVGLTDDEVKHMLELFVIPPQHIEMVVQAIEAKLKEKNT